MTVHKHVELIKAKAENMELVVFVKASAHGGKWFKIDWCDFPTNPHQEYFLCHPKHAGVCLHWLNGGEAQGKNCGEWVSFSLPEPIYWNACTSFMDDAWEIRIKPRKEKRWIGVYRGKCVTEKTVGTLQDAQEYVLSNPHYKHCAPEGWQFIQIEVEV